MPFSKYRKTSNYGWRNHPIRGGRRFHAGVDLVKKTAGVNAPIEAFIGGKVVHAGWGNTGSGIGGYGNVVIIKDANGRGHVYAHLDSVSVKKGQTVSKGQKIGNQGATPPENVTGAHLHYEIRKKTSPDCRSKSDIETASLKHERYVKNYIE